MLLVNKCLKNRILKLLARVVTHSPQSCSSCTLLWHLHWLPIKHCIDFKIAYITFRTLHCSNQLTYVHPCMPVIPLVSSDSPLCSVCLHIIQCLQFQHCSP